MKDYLRTIVSVIGFLIIATIVIVWLFGLNSALLPTWMRVQYDTRQQSASYIDAMNQQLASDMVEYNQTNEDAGKLAILRLMCEKIVRMDNTTVSPSARSFIASKGGCK